MEPRRSVRRTGLLVGVLLALVAGGTAITSAHVAESASVAASAVRPAAGSGDALVEGYVLGLLTALGPGVGWALLRRWRDAPAGSTSASAASASGSAATTAPTEAGSPRTSEAAAGAVSADELLPDDVFVRRLLEREGGRMRQSEIVEATTWSKAKVSRLLSRLAEEDAVVKLTLGRENLICLPGREPAIAEPTADARGRSGA